MHQFHDNQKRPWQLALTVGHQFKLKTLFNIEIRELSIFERLTDPEVFANILGCILETQLASKGIALTELLECLGADELDQVIDQLAQEIADFFHQRQRPIVKELLAKSATYAKNLSSATTEKVQSQQMDHLIQSAVMTEMKKIDQEMEKANQLAGIGTANSSGNLQESPA